MKKLYGIGLAAGVIAGLVFLLGCEWTTNTDSFNTSQGAGANINFSGVYYGHLGGGRAVSSTSGGSINRLVIMNSGNAIQVTDNQGSTYTGTIGSPGVIAAQSSGTYPAGALLSQAQISFSGHDNVAAKNVRFVGIIHAVSVEDIQGESEYSTNSTSISQGKSYSVTNESSVVTGGTNITTTLTIITYDDNGNETFRQVQTYTVTPSGQRINSSTSYIDSRSRNQGNQQETVTHYYLTEANVQYRLQGTWIEEGGQNANVDALSAGTAGVITTTSVTQRNDSLVNTGGGGEGGGGEAAAAP